MAKIGMPTISYIFRDVWKTQAWCSKKIFEKNFFSPIELKTCILNNSWSLITIMQKKFEFDISRSKYRSDRLWYRRFSETCQNYKPFIRCKLYTNTIIFILNPWFYHLWKKSYVQIKSVENIGGDQNFFLHNLAVTVWKLEKHMGNFFEHCWR